MLASAVGMKYSSLLEIDMIVPFQTRIVVARGLSLEDFAADSPKPSSRPPTSADADQSTLIEGVTASALTPHADERGWLCELLTTREEPIEPIVHVYQVAAAPGSIRAWIYHRRQHDRLAITNGSFEVVLYDLRPNSPTLNHLNVFRLGQVQPCLLRIPPYVVHGVRNVGGDWAFFVNMPTQAYRNEAPDKCRIPYDDPRIPYTFE